MIFYVITGIKIPCELPKSFYHYCILTNFIRLERSLRSFACLTKGDTIAIPYNKKVRIDKYECTTFPEMIGI